MVAWSAMATPDGYLEEAPVVHVEKSTVVKDQTQDLVLHTVKLEYQGWEWYTTIHWAQIKDLNTSLSYWRMRKLLSSSLFSSSSSNAPPSHSRPASVPNRRRMEDQNRPNTGGAGGGNSTRGRIGGGNKKASTKVDLPQALNSESATKTDSVSLSKQRLMYENYLREVLDVPIYRICPKVLELLQIGATTFDHRQGPSYREGYVHVRCWSDAEEEAIRGTRLDDGEGTSASSTLNSSISKTLTRRFVKRWAVLKNSFLALYKNRNDFLPEGVILFDTHTTVQSSLFDHGRVVILNSVWRSEIKADTNVEQRQWTAAVQAVLARSPWVERNRFTYTRSLTTSFLDQTTSSVAQWYVDGHAIYKTYYNAIKNAKSQIFIAGQWISPDLYLKRPPRLHPHSRLDRLLESKAKEGVHIYLLMFHEPDTMTIDSNYSKSRFSNLNHEGRIHVLRHGDGRFPHNWCHHEKILCIDQELAFVGSNDLGLGQYDTEDHLLRDDGKEIMWPNKDYSNPRIKDFVDVHEKTGLPGHDRSSVARMPVHGVQCSITGYGAMDICWHFIHRWNLARQERNKEGKVPALIPFGLCSLDLGPSKAAESVLESDEHVSKFVTTRKTLARLVFGGNSSVSEPPADSLNPAPSSPTAGTAKLMADKASQTVKEMLTSKKDKTQYRLQELRHEISLNRDELVYQGLTGEPSQPDVSRSSEWDDAASTRESPHSFLNDDEETKDIDRPMGEEVESVGPIASCRCNVVRSIGLWSGGYPEKQSSILEAYEQLVNSARHYVYIENTHFISGVHGDTTVTNRIADVLLNRIVRAHTENRNFKVIITLPLLPVFEGPLQGSALSSLMGVFYWQYRSLCRGRNSLLERLAQLVPDPSQYVTILGLRTYTVMSNQSDELDSSFVTEQIYVGSKVMIVDDKRCIIGSAAINERSLLGHRDSEMGVVLEDQTVTASTMDGTPYSAGEFCRSLRLRLWGEHMGIPTSEDRLIDPLSPKLWDQMRSVARINAAVYQYVFPEALPSNAVRSLDTLKQVSINGSYCHIKDDVTRVLGDDASEPCHDDQQRAHWLRKIQGHFVEFPMNFLADDFSYLQPTNILAEASM